MVVRNHTVQVQLVDINTALCYISLPAINNHISKVKGHIESSGSKGLKETPREYLIY